MPANQRRDRELRSAATLYRRLISDNCSQTRTNVRDCGMTAFDSSEARIAWGCSSMPREHPTSRLSGVLGWLEAVGSLGAPGSGRRGTLERNRISRAVDNLFARGPPSHYWTSDSRDGRGTSSANAVHAVHGRRAGALDLAVDREDEVALFG